MARKTHYDVLGIARDASSVDIASAFRDKLAELKAKPGVVPEAIDELREAYQTLANPVRRDDYDREIAPRAVTRAPKVNAARESDGAHRPFWSTPAFKYTIPVVILVIAFWGWKRQKPPTPPPEVVSVERTVQENSSAGDVGSREARPVASTQSPSSARSAEQVFADVSPSVVRVLVSDSSGRVTKQGSGVVIGSGRVITNCHVVTGGGQIAVKTGTNSRSASINVADEEFDLCSLDVFGLDAPAVTLGTVASVRTGQRVYAIGAPMGLELTISEGIVSSLREASGSKVIQTTAPVSPGSSGGGLFNTEAKLVGIVTFQNRDGQNLNFAVPVDWIGEMRTRGTSATGVGAGSSPGPGTQAPAATAEPTIGEMVVGSWYCFGSITGRNGEYTYAANGEMRISSADGRNVTGSYRVTGRRIVYQGKDGASTLEIESITRDHMVQLVGAGHRLACDRRS